MSTVKANNYLQLLDAARCNGEWDVVPEWSRKVQKHAPGRKCLALTASTEARLYRLLHPASESASATSYSEKLKALLDPLQTELDSHPNVPKLPSPAGGAHSMVITSDDVLQARTVLSWIYSLKGDWESALMLVPGEEEVGEEWSPGGGKGDYIGVIRIKSLVLKGIALAHMNPDDPSLPLQLYRAATKLPATYPQTQQTSVSFLLWTEKSLSHYALVAYRCWLDNQLPPGMVLSSPKTPRQMPGEWDGGEDAPRGEEQEEAQGEVGMAIGNTIIDEDSVARAFRAFHRFVAGLASAQQVHVGGTAVVMEKGMSPEKEQERREVYRNYFKFISLLLLPEGHPNRPIPQALPSPKPVAGSTVSVVPTNGPATGNMAGKAGTRDTLKAELKTIELVYEEYLLRGLSFPKANEYHEVVGEWVDLVVENWRVAGGSGEEAKPVVDILYRAAMKTFHSPRILRHLFTTLTATGNFPDAVRALDTYIDLVQRAKDRIAKGHEEKDFDDDNIILETAVEGIRVLCGLVDDGRKGMELAERIERWTEEWRVRSADALADVFRGIGIANATWARKTIDGETRPDIQHAAIKAFEKGLTYDPFDIEAWYGLALVQIEVGEIDSAMESAKKGLIILNYATAEESEEEEGGKRDYKRRAVPLLHLLALIMSATEDFEGARQACANVFEVLGEDMMVFRGMGISEKECVLEVGMTQLALEEVLDGAEVAVKMTYHLLGIYGRLFGAAQLNRGPPSVYENGQFDNSLSVRPKTANRKSRLLGGKNKKFSASVSSLPPGGLIGETGLSISGENKRPKSGHQSLYQPTGLSSNPNAPQIQVTDVHGGPSQTDIMLKKAGRPSSVSGGTIRRMKSFSSMRSGKGDQGSRMIIPDIPTPPLPSTTDTSSVERSPAGSIKDHHHHPHLFHTLKLKLHKHQLQEMGASGSNTEPSSQFGSTTSFMTTDSAAPTVDGTTELIGREAPRAEDIPNNLSQSKLPYPLRALRSGITDETGKDAKPRSIRRPKQLPEPKLHEEDEKRRALAALRRVWLFVGGLARRSGDFGGAAIALEEAGTLMGLKGEGEADLLAERAFLALDEGKKDLAVEYFNAAIALDVNHPFAIVGLSQVLLNIPTNSVPASAPAPTNNSVDVVIRPSTSSSITTAISPSSVTEEESLLSSLAATNRVLGLLEKLTSSSHGWDIPEAWFALARAYELSGETGRTKRALWRCVELEDVRAVRAWCNVRPRVL